MAGTSLIPLSIYVHFPWCIKKCPYCDFNSYSLHGTLPEKKYLDALLRDLAEDLPQVEGRIVHSIFMGGGTPSLFSPNAISCLFVELQRGLSLQPNLEVTLEVNPGTVEQVRFLGFLKAGVNRLSIGVQSFRGQPLRALGRIHGVQDAISAVKTAKKVGFKNINLDLMFGLPHQTVRSAMADLKQAISLEPTHISWYQLTLEPNTFFYRHPPRLPEESLIEDLYFQGLELLAQAGYQQYEISAYAKPGYECRHNRNYWEFGDYLGTGAGAHGKLTLGDGIKRFSKKKHPKRYLDGPPFIGTEAFISPQQLSLEFMMNALRLKEGFTWENFTERTGLSKDCVLPQLTQAAKQGWVRLDTFRVCPTALGMLFLNSILESFVSVIAMAAKAKQVRLGSHFVPNPTCIV